MPEITLEDHLRKAGPDIVKLLTNLPTNPKKEYKTNSIYKALLELGQIFCTAEEIPLIKDLKT